jgi:hypothetical protein
LDIKKCEFEVKSTKYPGFIIDTERGLCMDLPKIEAITNWKAPTSVKGVRRFLEFANFYRRFIQDFANIAAPLTRLTGDVTWRWTQQDKKPLTNSRLSLSVSLYWLISIPTEKL